MISKVDLKAALKSGATLESLLEFRAGQECEIYKAEKFLPGNTVLYIPDLSLNEIPIDRPITDPEELKDVLDRCYTGDDFIAECSGDAELAERLFWFCDWQTPSAPMGEGFGTDY